MNDIGRLLIIVGVVVLIVGILFSILPKSGGIPKLPGDIVIKKDNVTFYFPWVTSIIISIIVSFIFYLFRR